MPKMRHFTIEYMSIDWDVVPGQAAAGAIYQTIAIEHVVAASKSDADRIFQERFGNAARQITEDYDPSSAEHMRARSFYKP